MGGNRRHKKPRTAEEDALISRLQAEKKTYWAISEILGRHPNAVFTRIRWGKRNSKGEFPTERVLRTCLRCRKSFEAKGRHIRLCEQCGDYAKASACSMA